MADLVHVKGLSALNKFLQELPVKVEQNILSGALRAGANVIKADAAQRTQAAGLSRHVSIRVSVRKRHGKVRARIVAMSNKNEAIWAEYGTKAHFIMVKKEAKPGRMTRRGYRKLSIGTINKMVAHGSLVIGKNFVGESVSHPGARPRPFLRPALDSQAQAAVMAAAEYIKRRLVNKHGLTQAAEVELEPA